MLKAGPQKRCRSPVRANSEEIESGAVVVRERTECETCPCMSEGTVERCGARAVCLPVYHCD